MKEFKLNDHLSDSKVTFDDKEKKMIYERRSLIGIEQKFEYDYSKLVAVKVGTSYTRYKFLKKYADVFYLKEDGGINGIGLFSLFAEDIAIEVNKILDENKLSDEQKSEYENLVKKHYEGKSQNYIIFAVLILVLICIVTTCLVVFGTIFRFNPY